MVAQSICISKAVINSWGTVIITHNTVVMKWQPAVLYKDNNSSKKCTWERKMKDKMMKLGAISNDLPLSISVPHISLLLSPRVCPFISPSLAVAFASCTSACFIAETITDGLCVRCKGWHWGRSQDPRVRGGYQSPSRGIMNHRGGGGRVKVECRHGARFLGLMTRSEIGFAGGSIQDEQEARQMLSLW